MLVCWTLRRRSDQEGTQTPECWGRPCLQGRSTQHRRLLLPSPRRHTRNPVDTRCSPLLWQHLCQDSIGLRGTPGQMGKSIQGGNSGPGRRHRRGRPAQLSCTPCQGHSADMLLSRWPSVLGYKSQPGMPLPCSCHTLRSTNPLGKQSTRLPWPGSLPSQTCREDKAPWYLPLSTEGKGSQQHRGKRLPPQPRRWSRKGTASTHAERQSQLQGCIALPGKGEQLQMTCLSGRNGQLGTRHGLCPGPQRSPGSTPLPGKVGKLSLSWRRHDTQRAWKKCQRGTAPGWHWRSEYPALRPRRKDSCPKRRLPSDWCSHGNCSYSQACKRHKPQTRQRSSCLESTVSLPSHLRRKTSQLDKGCMMLLRQERSGQLGTVWGAGLGGDTRSRSGIVGTATRHQRCSLPPALRPLTRHGTCRRCRARVKKCPPQWPDKGSLGGSPGSARDHLGRSARCHEGSLPRPPLLSAWWGILDPQCRSGTWSPQRARRCQANMAQCAARRRKGIRSRQGMVCTPPGRVLKSGPRRTQRWSCCQGTVTRRGRARIGARQM